MVSIMLVEPGYVSGMLVMLGFGSLSTRRVYRIQCTVCHTPLGRFSKVDCLTTKRAPIPNGTSAERPLIDAFNADLFGSDTIPTINTTAVEISTMENRPRGVS